MILPSKHLSPERALLTVGADILVKLHRPYTVSKLWDEIRNERRKKNAPARFTYEWFILALCLLFTLGTISFKDGLLERTRP